MGDGATNVRYEAIATFEEALGRFAQTALERMKTAETTIRRTAESLESRRSELRREISQLQDEISNADEEEDTSRSQQRLEEAEEAVAHVRRWQAEVEAAAQRYKRQAEQLERVSTGATADARAYLRGLLDDLAAYFALQKDDSSGHALGAITGSDSIQGAGSGVNGMDFSDSVAEDPTIASRDADVDAFRRRQGVLAFEAKTKEYQRRLNQYPELSSLSPEEYLAINRYSQFDFKNINEALRGDDAGEKKDWGPHMRVAVSALEKLPIYEGLVFRGTDKKPFADAYRLGSIVVERGFTSTSQESKGSNGSPVQFEIQSKKGRDISSCSAMQSEAAREGEVLFVPNTAFEITDRFERDGATIIRMKEV